MLVWPCIPVFPYFVFTTLVFLKWRWANPNHEWQMIKYYVLCVLYVTLPLEDNWLNGISTAHLPWKIGVTVNLWTSFLICIGAIRWTVILLFFCVCFFAQQWTTSMLTAQHTVNRVKTFARKYFAYVQHAIPAQIPVRIAKQYACCSNWKKLYFSY
jgi:hypothetical protein